VFVSTADNRVLALRTTDGTVQWARQLAGTLGSPVVVGSRLFVSGNEVVYALDAVDGRVKWHWRGWADIVGVTADRERVYVAALDNIVRALGAGNGNQRWKTVLNTRLLHAPQMIGDMVVVGGLEPAMTVIDSRRGTIRGTYALPELSIVATGPIVLPDRQSDGVMAILFTQAGDVIGLHPQPAKTDKATTDKKPADVSVVTP
jgi:outer membrane protein assembly factor BamB